jgi:hypothetical protein
VPLARLEDLRDRHRGEDVVVCGCGRSLRQFAEPGRYTTIGVNDVGRRFVPEYLVVVNPVESFTADRWAHVRDTNPPVFLSQYRLAVRAGTYVQFRLGRYASVDFDDPGALNYTQNSPYVALCLAVHLGARRIGVYGVDFTDDHFFAATGRHALAGRLAEIDEQFRRLDEACRARGVEIVNLSTESRLTAFRRGRIEEIRPRGADPAPPPAAPARPRVFFVNHTFHTAGDVFRDGLVHAARELDLPHAVAGWDDPTLPQQVARFVPDLLFVVHGRMFTRRWARAFARYRTAVWLVDEPYEVDDTSRYSGLFDHVFVNDPATLSRHPRAAYLPLAYDPVHCFDAGGERRHAAGFVGGASPTREAALEPLARADVLSYVVGGPWRSPALGRRCLAARVTPAEAATLYRQTRVVVNIFRDRHHWNHQGLVAGALNPRIYEAVAAGALVVSEPRRELAELVPELPVFDRREELVTVVRHFLEHPEERDAVSAACRRRLAGHTFADRLRRVIAMSLGDANGPSPAVVRPIGTAAPPLTAEPTPGPPASATLPGALGEEWRDHGGVAAVEPDGTITLRKSPDGTPGSERGLASCRPYRTAELAFEVRIAPGACFVAKIHQGDQLDQSTNSYHLMGAPPRSYLARHHHVFAPVPLAADRWERIRLAYRDGVLTCYHNDQPVFRSHQSLLTEGYAFLGLKGGEAQLRNVRLTDSPTLEAVPDELTVLHGFSTTFEPRVSIITTVYDRVDCLRRCLRSVRALRYRDWEQIVVADAPPDPVLTGLASTVSGGDHGRVLLATVARRFDNWGIGPAAAGLRRARGGYVCFLSDDNGYAPDHLDPLVHALDTDPGIGFAYSSCRYDGRLILDHPVPRPGGIDLGQPLFRRDLFARHLGDGLPFDVAAWDWHLIDTFMRHGVRWRHVNRPTFLFRLAKYPEFAGGLP